MEVPHGGDLPGAAGGRGVKTFYVALTDMAAFRAEWDARLAEYLAKRDAFASEYPHHQLRESLSQDWGGVEGLKASNDFPRGPWRYAINPSRFIPDGRTKTGKELQRRLYDLRFVRPPFPGMPRRLNEGYAQWDEIAGRFWIAWSCAPAAVEASPEFDPNLWERQKQSAYWLAKEAAEEPAP